MDPVVTIIATGVQGLTGATGPQGPTGPTGPQGSVGPAGPEGPSSNPSNKYEFTLTSEMLSNETSPGVIRVDLPSLQTFGSATIINGFVDGRYQRSGYGWQPSTDGLAVEVYLPTDTPTRTQYLNANIEYAFIWNS